MAYPTSIDPSVIQYFQNHPYANGQTPQYQVGNTMYTGQYTQGQYGGEGSTPSMTLSGILANPYDKEFATHGGDMGQYDLSGKYLGTQHQNADDWNYDTLAMAAAGAFGVGFAAMAGGGLAGMSGAQAAASNGSWDVSGLEGAASNGSWDVAGSGGGYAGDATAAGYDPAYGSAGGDVATNSNNAYDYRNGSDIASDAATANGVVQDGQINSGVNTGGQGANIGGSSGTSTGTTTGNSGGTTSTGGGNNSGNGLNLGSIVGLLNSIYGANQQDHASQAMLDYLRERQGINDNMYKTGSPEFNTLWDEMSRKDAAAGRNSQYGPRSVDLASRVAQLKMNANTQLTSNISKYMAESLQNKANSGAGIAAALPGLLGNGGGNNISLDDITKWLGSLG